MLYALVALILILGLLVHGAKPSKTLAWILAILTVPVGGILFYWVLGRNRRRKKLSVDKLILPGEPEPALASLPVDSLLIQKVVRIAYNHTQLAPSQDNELCLLTDGKSTFEAIFQALEAATDHIHLQYYIFEEGELTQRLLELFKRKITQGVRVRLIYDVIGSFTLSSAYRRKLEKAGVEVFPFLPFRFGRFLESLNHRNHRKIIVVDNRVAFTGGINVSDKYLKGDPVLGNWHDMYLRVSGRSAWHLNRIFLEDWYTVSGQNIYDPQWEKATITPAPGKVAIQILHGGPDDDFASLEWVYLAALLNAQRYVYIINPYIIPGPALQKAMVAASRSGIDVRVLLSESSDSRIVGWSVRSYFEGFLRAGIKIYLYPEGFLHSKMVVADDNFAMVGTANLDSRSLEHNFEVNALVYDQGVAQQLKEDFLKEINISRMLAYHEFRERSWGDKLKEGIGRVLSPLL